MLIAWTDAKSKIWNLQMVRVYSQPGYGPTTLGGIFDDSQVKF